MAPKPSTADSASKRRRVSAATEESALLTSIAASKTRDYDYICATIKDQSELSSYIARLLRDGALNRALASRSAPTISAELGKKLPARTKRMRHLSYKFLSTFFDKVAQHPLYEPADDGRPLWTMNREIQLDLMQFVLHVWADAEIPHTHAGSGYEEPLMSPGTMPSATA